MFIYFVPLSSSLLLLICLPSEYRIVVTVTDLGSIEDCFYITTTICFKPHIFRNFVEFAVQQSKKKLIFSDMIKANNLNG